MATAERGLAKLICGRQVMEQKNQRCPGLVSHMRLTAAAAAHAAVCPWVTTHTLCILVCVCALAVRTQTYKLSCTLTPIRQNSPAAPLLNNRLSRPRGRVTVTFLLITPFDSARTMLSRWSWSTLYMDERVTAREFVRKAAPECLTPLSLHK